MAVVIQWAAVCVFMAVLSRFDASAANPGLQARITQNGINYANKVAIDVLTKSVTGEKIPDQRGHAKHVDYTVSGLQIEGFSRPSSSILLHPPTGLLWKAQNAGVSLKGNFHYKYKHGIIKISDHGRFDVSVNGLGFSLNLLLGMDSNGRPSIKSGGCTSNVGSVDVKFHGGRAFIYNLFRSKVEKAIKGMLESKMSGLINNLVNTDGGKALSKLRVIANIGKKFTLDYRLIQKPQFTASYMETFHKGEVFWTNKHQEAPFSAAVFPPISSNNRMMYVWMSDYIVNSMTYQAQQNGFLVYNLTAKELPPGNRSVLNTTCVGGICIGTFIPALKQFPGCQVELVMASKVTPNVGLHDGQIQAHMGGEINFLAVHPVKKAQIFLFTLGTTAAVNVTLNLKNEMIFYKVKAMQVKVKVTKAAIKGISDVALQFIVNQAVNRFVEKKLNDLGAKGFPLPLTDSVKLVNTQLQLVKDALVIATDVSYQH